jgi:type IV pilus assembly protein PilX
MTPHHTPLSAQARRESGAALVVGLILLLVLTLLAISGMTTASLELQMAGNEQYKTRAFEAADAGVEQAITAGIYNTNSTAGTYNTTVPVNPVPIRGEGLPIANCVEVDDPAESEECEYFMRFDQQSGQTVVPGGGYSLGTGFEAYHFVIDSFGVAERGGLAEHRQSFYIVGPGGT